ncbi:hypothetical protein NQU17_03900 [Clostridiaceae bacterium HFYG-1003]|nr:hypothetical protein NQU17_03900 [Clostridiaceae bacterium HFYG-1003]
MEKVQCGRGQSVEEVRVWKRAECGKGQILEEDRVWKKAADGERAEDVLEI